MVIPRNSGNATTVTTPSDTEIVVTRAFDAPSRLVFEAWTSCEHLPHWMGPATWTMSTCEIDLRPGGTYRLVWTSPDGADLEIRGTYREIAPPSRLVSTESWGADWPDTHNTLVLTEEGRKTTTTVTISYPSKEARDAALGTGMADGMSAGYDRLDDYLQTID